MSGEKEDLRAGLKAFAGLLDEFRRENIANTKVARQSLDKHLVDLCRRWDERFPDFPKSWFPYLSFIGLSRRGPRNAHLKKIIIQHLKDMGQNHSDRVIVNPACFLGRRARSLASCLKSFRIIAMDVNPYFNSFYKYICRTPANYEFRQDSIFNPTLKVRPSAVVFFGACGSVTDAAMDYLIESNSPYLFCRTCCQYAIGGNIEAEKGFNLVNSFWGLQKPRLLWILKKKKGHYFSPDYSMDKYPRSQAAKDLTDSKEYLKITRYVPGSGICRTIIDLDRYMYLAEHGYNVWYREEIFIAEKRVE